MKSRYYWFASLLLVLSMLLGACATAATPTVAPTTPPTATTVVEPTALPEPTATPLAEAGPAQLDTAFSSALGNMDHYNTIQLDALAEALTQDPKPFLLDVREVSEVEKSGHIDGSVLIPLRELGQNLDKLPSFDTPIVSYCGSGWRCTIAMTALTAMGWQDVTCLKGNSYTGWVEADYATVPGLAADAAALDAANPDASLVMSFDRTLSNLPKGWGVITADDLAAALAENPDLNVIDVRTAQEVEDKGTIEATNYVNIPLEEFVAMKDQWPADQSAPIVVYCGSGHRSTMAMTILDAYGYQDVRSLKGGFAAWVDADFPVLGGTPADPTAALDGAYQSFLAGMKSYNTISLDALNTALAEGPQPFLLDVREVSEAEENGYIEGAILIPLRELGQNLDKLPSFDTPIVSYCGSGWRCTIAMTELSALGWQNVTCLKGGSFGGWVDAGYPVATGVPPEAEALNAASPDPALVEFVDATLSDIPQGFGGVSVEDLAAELVENPDLAVIDVRTPVERSDKGVLDAANQTSIPLEELINMKDQWPVDKTAPVVVYCGSGHRSTIAMTILWSYGYTDVRSMKGGFAAWNEAGLTIAQVATP